MCFKKYASNQIYSFSPLIRTKFCAGFYKKLQFIIALLVASFLNTVLMSNTACNYKPTLKQSCTSRFTIEVIFNRYHTTGRADVFNAKCREAAQSQRIIIIIQVTICLTHVIRNMVSFLSHMRYNIIFRTCSQVDKFTLLHRDSIVPNAAFLRIFARYNTGRNLSRRKERGMSY